MNVKAEVWHHCGQISVQDIKKRTGAWKVLIPVISRSNVKGDKLIGHGTVMASSSGETLWKTLNLAVEPVHEFFSESNQQYAAIIPKCILSKEAQKKATYRIIELKDSFIWIEVEGKKHRVGERFKTNTFILLKKDEPTI